MWALVANCIRRNDPKSSAHSVAGHLPLAPYQDQVRCAECTCSKNAISASCEKISSDDDARQDSRASHGPQWENMSCNSASTLPNETASSEGATRTSPAHHQECHAATLRSHQMMMTRKEMQQSHCNLYIYTSQSRGTRGTFTNFTIMNATDFVFCTLCRTRSTRIILT